MASGKRSPFFRAKDYLFSTTKTLIIPIQLFISSTLVSGSPDKAAQTHNKSKTDLFFLKRMTSKNYKQHITKSISKFVVHSYSFIKSVFSSRIVGKTRQ